jgi:type II secretory pathway pseudopilin PulG
LKKSGIIISLIAATVSACSVGATAPQAVQKATQNVGAPANSAQAQAKSYSLTAVDFKGNKEELTILPATETPPPLTDPSKAVPNSNEDNNLANPKNKHKLNGRKLPGAEVRGDLKNRKIKDSDPIPPAQTSFSDYMGTQFKQISPSPSTASIGVYAAHQVHLNMDIGGTSVGDNQRVVYAPTLLPPNNCAMEVVTAYVRYWNYFSTDRFFGVYNHKYSSSAPWQVAEPMDSTFVSKYVRKYFNYRDQYFTQVNRDGNSTNWRVYLYNFNTSSWEQKCQYNGNTNWHTGGWDMHERYLKSYCMTIPSIEADNIKVCSNGLTFVDASAWNNNASSSGYSGSSCTFNFVNDNGPGAYYWWRSWN